VKVGNARQRAESLAADRQARRYKDVAQSVFEREGQTWLTNSTAMLPDCKMTKRLSLTWNG